MTRQTFLLSNGLISDHQFGFRPGRSALDMLLLLSQQWMEVLNARHEIRAISRDISRAFDTVWQPALLTKLSSRLEFLKVAFWALFFFWFSSMISPTLWKILYISLLMTPPSAIPSVIPQTGKQQLLHSLQIWIKSQTRPTCGTRLSIRTNLRLSRCLSERTV